MVLEVGSKKVFASALDWPGWSRSGATEEAALAALAAYVERYAPVVERAGLSLPSRAVATLDVVEVLPGSATTDFGAPGAAAAAEDRGLTKAQAARLAALVEACWSTLDDVVAGAPPTLRKGPRGGGRDRDEIVAHVVEAHRTYLRKIDVRVRPLDPFDPAAVGAMRAATVSELVAARAAAPDLPTPWSYRYASRRMAWHFLDHAWEIEDKSE